VKWKAQLVCVVALVACGARGQEVAANLPLEASCDPLDRASVYLALWISFNNAVA